MRLIKCLFFVVALTPVYNLVFAQQDITPAPAFSPEQLTALPTDAWLTNGGNIYNQRFSPLDQINTDNVANLKGAWRTHLNGSGMETKYSGEAQPIMYEGVLYIITGANDVFALSVESGDILWQYTSNVDQSVSTVCCGWTNRGVAIGDGKVFHGQLDGMLVALDQQTGDAVWKIQAESWQAGYTLTPAPLYYDGMVITGFAGAEFGTRGRIKAYDADTGELIWSFYTVPEPGDFGSETWPADSDAWMYGGASVWQTPAVDPELGLIYFSTGNPGPDFNGLVREGDNLFTASVLALDINTGEYRWHFQEVHHDIWDYDASNPVILFDMEYEGEPRKAIVQVNKTGWAYILDRITGEPLIGIEERPVLQEERQATAKTQPYPLGDAIVPQSIDIAPEGEILVNQGRIFTPFYGQAGVSSAPGISGGANWPPSSLDPEKSLLFVCASDMATTFIGGDTGFEPPPAGETRTFYGGGRFGVKPYQDRGIIAALDMKTNKLVWRFRWEEECYSGTMVTGGDLLFVGRNDGRLQALSSDNGLPLWEFQTGAGMNSPVSTFVWNGVQYIAAYSAGNLFAGSSHGDSVWLFSLEGNMTEVNAGDNEAMYSVMSEALVIDGPADIAAGAQLYQQTCLPCHGEEGLGGHGGGASLVDIATNLRAIITTITTGKNEDMPSFQAALSAQQIRDVGSYIMEDLFQ